MPRQRAVRVIGAALAVSMVPGVRPRLGRTATNSSTQVICRGDRRECQKGAEANFAKYCCPSPSWQWFCGGQQNGYRCTNTCPSSKRTFPCTAAIAHPESGINGVCCDRRIHSGCVRIGPPAEKGKDEEGKPVVVPSQAWKPSCCPKGPGFSFCGGVCCEQPNRCRNALCFCPDGTQSLDGRRCCRRGQQAVDCLSVGTALTRQAPHLDASLVGRKCCPSSKPHCCGTACCAELGCCGTKCCPADRSRCASWRGQKVCCPTARVAILGDEQVCCPSGTVGVPNPPGGCCPQSATECCGSLASGRPACAPGKICVRGACVNL